MFIRIAEKSDNSNDSFDLFMFEKDTQLSALNCSVAINLQIYLSPNQLAVVVFQATIREHGCCHVCLTEGSGKQLAEIKPR